MPNQSWRDEVHHILQDQIASEVNYESNYSEKRLNDALVKTESILISFIDHLLKERDEEVVRMIEGSKLHCLNPDCHCTDDYNKALDDFKTKLGKGE